MFKNREIKVTMNKKSKVDANEAAEEAMSFEHKTEFILNKLERFGTKAFVGVGLYVLLDTVRQIAVAKANNP